MLGWDLVNIQHCCVASFGQFGVLLNRCFYTEWEDIKQLSRQKITLPHLGKFPNPTRGTSGVLLGDGRRRETRPFQAFWEPLIFQQNLQ